ncbi:lamin tail domain-containing protein [archaeon]|nr:lamin tail domain-containing protein [archaeon]
MKIVLITIFLLFLLPTIGSSIYINEVMYDPNGTDTSHEWIELYNNDSDTYNLTGWKLNTNGTNHILNAPPINGGTGTMIIGQGNYAIIVQDASTFLADYLYNGTVIDSSWTDLSNSMNETIWIRNSTAVFHNLTYAPISTEGKSVCLINETLTECIPTPGYANVQVDSNSTSNQTNTTNNNTSPSSALCNLSIAINTNSTVYEQGKIEFDIVVNDTNCNSTIHNATVNYFVEDIFGSIVKTEENKTINFTCLGKIENRQWTPDAIQGSEAYFIRSFISYTGCNGTDDSSNNASKLIVVKGSQAAQMNESSIIITYASTGSDNEIKYGEHGEVNINVYRGNTQKNSVDIFVKDSAGNKISETTNLNVKNKFSSYNLSVPIQMKPNCDGSYPDGNFTVVAEGLDVNSTKPVNVRGISSSVCKTITVSSGSSGGSSCSSTTGTTVNTSRNCNLTLYEVRSYEPSVEIDKEFFVTVRITNTFQTAKNFTVYSYAFSGNNPVTLGFDNNLNKWKASYNGNSQDLELPQNSSSVAYLRNKIENGTEPGVYSLRARINVDGKSNDITNQISVTRQNNTQAFKDARTPIINIENKTESKKTTENAITGLSVGKSSKAKNNYAYNETHIAYVIAEMLKMIYNNSL